MKTTVRLAESLAGTQAKQFRAKYGIVPHVSDKTYFTNSFHCHVSEDITPTEKQDKEVDLFNTMMGGHIQYVRIGDTKNTDGLKAIIRRGMAKGFYQGVNFNAKKGIIAKLAELRLPQKAIFFMRCE